mmetsp:Transcript_134940/g.252282  ORF Transcript_134940/g.252282 Transcript_134940/m.252282 type:complete len:410 (-) Transcript_134940:48-1277(-)
MASNFAAQGRSGTFIVGTERQRNIMDTFQRNEQHFTEEYQKNKPLCFSARAYQMTHPGKMRGGHKDADATLSSPMLLGVADGVSQLEEFGMDAAELPHELLRTCEELAMAQLIPDRVVTPQDSYRGPVALLKEAYEATESLGSTTVLLGILDNSTRIHGKLHPMVAVLTIGDCELLMLRRLQGRTCPLQAVFHTEMQRIGGHAQQPIQIARIDERVDPDFDEDCAIEVIQRGSAVHYVSAYAGDVIVMGSDGVFDNLFLDEIVDTCNQMLRPRPYGAGERTYAPTDPEIMRQVAQRIVLESHAKTQQGMNGHFPEAPIGRGGKVDDTSCVVSEVVEWTDVHNEVWTRARRRKRFQDLITCGGNLQIGCHDDDHELELMHYHGMAREIDPRTPGRDSSYDDDEDDKCSIL